MSNTLRKNPPDFVRTAEQLSYYMQLIDLFESNDVPIQNQDVHSIGALAINLALLDECMVSIAEDGAMMEVQGDRHMIRKTNPSVNMLKDAQAAIRHYFKEFKMSPSSRGTGGGLLKPTGMGNDGFDNV